MLFALLPQYCRSGGLALLVVYMIWRAVQAVTVLTKHRQDERLKVIDHVGFFLIFLFDGFAIVSALDLHAPGWLVAAMAVGAVGVGIFGIIVRKKTLKMQTSDGKFKTTSSGANGRNVWPLLQESLAVIQQGQAGLISP